MLRTSVVTALLCCVALSQPKAAASPDWNAVAAGLGKSGTEMPGGVYRVGLPRSDLTVTLDGVTLKPSLALGSWLAFAPRGNSTVVMGDLVLTEEEVGPVMSKLAEEKIEITALHNHLFRAKPMTFYMHVYAEGEAVALAREMHAALVLSKTPLGTTPPPAAAAKIDLNTAAIDRALGATGKIAGGVYQVGIPRSAPVTEHGMTLTAAMGAAESINFQQTGKGNAAITGDFVLAASEVNPVLRALRDNGIEVTALHNHMLDEQPHLFFMHFWANNDLDKLLGGLHAALQQVAVQRTGAK
jgi:hypothetical protein